MVLAGLGAVNGCERAFAISLRCRCWGTRRLSGDSSSHCPMRCSPCRVTVLTGHSLRLASCPHTVALLQILTSLASRLSSSFTTNSSQTSHLLRPLLIDTAQPCQHCRLALHASGTSEEACPIKAFRSPACCLFRRHCVHQHPLQYRHPITLLLIRQTLRQSTARN